MARIEQVTCDECGIEKQKSNHWFVITYLNGTVLIRSASALDGPAAGAAKALGRESVNIDCCGEAHVIKKVSELIAPQASK